MSGRPVVQEYAVNRRGARYVVHTPRLGERCRCNGCHQRRYWTPERRAARGALLRQQFGDGTRVPARNVNEGRASVWRAEEDALVRELAGQQDCLTIGRMLGERFGNPRSEAAVKYRVKRLGIYLLDVRPLSSSEVGRIFGVTRETVRTRFVNRGLLVGRLRRGGPHGMRMFTRPELERLIREHPEAYDAGAIRDPSLRALAAAVNRGRRPLGTAEVAHLVGMDPRTLAGWYLAGLVPAARFVRGVRPGAGGAWLLPASEVETVRRLRAGRADARRAKAEARRDPLTGAYLSCGETPSTALRFRLRIVERTEAERRVAP